jgi:hypothetical protein
MKSKFKKLLILIGITCIPIQQSVYAADTAIASFNVSGTVPVFFSISTRGVPGDLDLSPNVTVNNRLIGLMHLKYNVNIASLTIASSTASGAPEGPAGSYSFQGGGFFVSVDAGCTSVAPAYNAPFVLSAAGTDIKSVASTALVAGVEEDCQIRGSWRGTATALPLGGVYSMSVTVTMVSM